MTTSAGAPDIERVTPLFDATALRYDPGVLRQRAAADGYLFFRALVPREAVDALRADVLEQCARRGWLEAEADRHDASANPDAAVRATRDELLALQADIQIRPTFTALRHDSQIDDVLCALFNGPPAAGHGDVARLAFPRDLERTTRPHQDWFYTRGSTSLWTVWVPLGDCPASLGGLAVLPGSHANGLRAHDGGEGEARYILLGDDAPWVGEDFCCGDVLMFNALTIHGARPNITERTIRISADFRYRPANDRVS